MISFEGVTKKFGDRVVLDSLDLEIPTGQATAIIGRSGTGKSVLLKHIVGLLRPDSGRVRVDGQTVHQLEPEALARLRSRFGYVFQFAALFDSLTIGENVAMGLRKQSELGPAEIARRIDEALDLVDLPNVQDRFLAELSGGLDHRRTPGRIRRPTSAGPSVTSST